MRVNITATTRRDPSAIWAVFNVCCKLNYLGIEFKCRGIDEHRHVKNMIRKADTAVHFMKSVGMNIFGFDPVTCIKLEFVRLKIDGIKILGFRVRFGVRRFRFLTFLATWGGVSRSLQRDYWDVLEVFDGAKSEFLVIFNGLPFHDG